VSLAEELDDPDDLARLLAVERAGRDGGPELIGKLLGLALHDGAEVQVTGGVAERWDSLSDAEVEVLGPEAEVLLRDPRYARGGGLLVIIETATGTVLRVIPQL
jgi:hypothetical protein